MGDQRTGISVVIPCYNAAATLGLQLEALSRQADPPEFEVIVVDNRSTDHLASVIERWSSRLPGLRVASALAAQGVSYARNVGIAAAEFDHVAICDADDVVSEFWLRDLWRCLADHEVVSGSALDTADGVFSDVDAVWAVLDVTGGAYREPPAPFTPEAYPIMMGGNCAMKRATALALRGFDQSYARGSDDADFAMRLNVAGIAIAHSPVCRVAYRNRAGTRQLLIMNFHRGVMHARQCARFDLWDTSPYYGPGWRWGALRALAAGGLMAARRKRPDWPGVASRLGASAGLMVGFVTHRVLRRVPPRQLGVGLAGG